MCEADVSPGALDAAALLLSAVIEACRSDLAAAAAPFRIAWVFMQELRSSPGSRSVFRVAAITHDERAVLLCGGPREVPLPADMLEGSYDGEALYLLEGGELLALLYEGSWNDVRAFWWASMERVTVCEAARRFPVGQCVDALELALERAGGNPLPADR